MSAGHRIRHVLVAACAAATLARGQTSLSGPLLGYTFDSERREIRPVWGIPGASRAGDPISLDAASVSMAPARNFALATAADGAIQLIRLDRTNATSQTIGSGFAAPRIVLSTSASAAAILENGSAQIFSGLPDSPALLWSAPVPSPIVSAAISDDGSALLFSVAGSGLFALASTDAAPRPISTSSPAAMSFFAQSHDAVVAGDPDGSVAILRGLSLLPLAADDRLTAPAAVAATPDGRRILVAIPQHSLVAIIDTNNDANNAAVTTVTCNCAPSELRRWDDALFQLTEPATGMVWSLDLSQPDPRIFFVPVFHPPTHLSRRGWPAP
jgi:hypothetical protein